MRLHGLRPQLKAAEASDHDVLADLGDGLLDELQTVIRPVKNRMWYEGMPENNLRLISKSL